MRLSDEQAIALEQFKKFVNSRDSIFVLTGFAGSGKTTLVKAFCDYLKGINRSSELMASTGRAAKILQEKTSIETLTVHRKIYIFNELLAKDEALEKHDDTIHSDDVRLSFVLRSSNQDHLDTVYIVDESSMIADSSQSGVSQSEFGSGKLLTDFLKYANMLDFFQPDAVPHRKIVFVGDLAQLPPVSNETFSPALNPPYLKRLKNSHIWESHLTEVFRYRQDSGIGILAEATRQIAMDGIKRKIPQVSDETVKRHLVKNNSINEYYQKLASYGPAYSIYVCPSNNNAGAINVEIRKKLYKNTEKLQTGDVLLITQNSYVHNFYNGDLVEVTRIGSKHESRAGLQFFDISVKILPDGIEKDILLISDVIWSHDANITAEQFQRLIIDFSYRMKERGIKPKTREFYDAMYTDVYLNAIRAKFGYAITCHKAQGGEWNEVFLHGGSFMQGWGIVDYYRWLYTGITRAKEKIHLFYHAI